MFGEKAIELIKELERCPAPNIPAYDVSGQGRMQDFLSMSQKILDFM